jgi:tetraacyldisaccharide 4'-kinase
VDSARFARKHLLKRSCLSYALYPASVVVAAYMRLRRRYFFRRPYRAEFKVISIGNLSCGGSGKTPIAIALARELQKLNQRVAYSSRGYKSPMENMGTMISDGNKPLASFSIAGDEATMAATILPGVPVFCGKQRKQVLIQAECALSYLDVMILDDAFQHLKVARDIDILVFDSELGLGNGFVLPAGYLREGLSAIAKDTICLLHQKPQGKENPELKARLQATGAKVYTVVSSSGEILNQGKKFGLSRLQDKRINLVSGIAHPDSFANSVSALGIKYQKHYIFPDHHDFQDRHSRNQLNSDDSDYLLCTAKDAVKLMPILGDKLLILCMDTQLPRDLMQELYARITE